MQPNDFVYQQIYKGCLAKGVKEGIARDAAIMGLGAYKKGKHGGKKVADLIANSITQANKISKGVK